jgi:hypothetical protein
VDELAINTADFYAKYRKQMDKMIGNTGSFGLDSIPNGVSPLSKSLISKINASKTQLESMETKLKDTMAFIRDFSGNLTGLLNCKTIRRDIIIFSNTFCYNFGTAFAEQSYYFAWIGPL